MPDLILIRGLPGSGKSTLAKKLHKTHHHIEQDTYFKRDNRCLFDPIKLRNAQDWCLEVTEVSLTRGLSVVVSNWFITNAEVAPYIELAKRLNINVQVIELVTAYQNIHRIPLRTIAVMRTRWEPLKQKELLMNPALLALI